MKKLLTSLLLIVLISLSLSSAVLAQNEKTITFGGLTDACYIRITNVTGEKVFVANDGMEYPLYVAALPVTVTFGDWFGREAIYYSTTFDLDDISSDSITVSEPVFFEEDVEFAVKKMDEEEFFYLGGNYATLNKPGLYLIESQPEAMAPQYIILKVVGTAGAPDKEPAVSDKPAKVTATPTTSKVLLNGKEVSFEAYNIGGYNYFKLRDLAMVLSGTEKQFEVGWDGVNRVITLTTGQAYTAVGGELTISENPAAREGTSNTSKIYLNGAEISLTAYTIGGNNYFKLRDIGKAIDFGVIWDEATKTIHIDTSVGYTE